jgi:hypothetical protein
MFRSTPGRIGARGRDSVGRAHVAAATAAWRVSPARTRRQ